MTRCAQKYPDSSEDGFDEAAPPRPKRSYAESSGESDESTPSCSASKRVCGLKPGDRPAVLKVDAGTQTSNFTTEETYSNTLQRPGLIAIPSDETAVMDTCGFSKNQLQEYRHSSYTTLSDLERGTHRVGTAAQALGTAGSTCHLNGLVIAVRSRSFRRGDPCLLKILCTKTVSIYAAHVSERL